MEDQPSIDSVCVVVNIDLLCGRIGSASHPVHSGEALNASNAPEPATSMLTRKIDAQAGRVRMLSNQIATALEGLEL